MLAILAATSMAWGSGAELGAITACHDGVGEACRLAAEAHLAGDGVPVDLPAALDLFASGCELGNGESCLRLAEHHEDGDGVPLDLVAAMEWYAAGCELGEADACRTVGEAHLSGVLEEGGEAAADPWFRQGCNHGDPPSCLAAAEAHMNRAKGDSAVIQEAVGLYQLACEGGLVEGCTSAAWRLADASPSDAPPWFELGCGLGDVPSCREIGLAQMSGSYVPRDRAAARGSLAQACRADDRAACAGLGELLKRTDPEAALDAASRACGLGSDKACRRAWRLRRKVER